MRFEIRDLTRATLSALLVVSCMGWKIKTDPRAFCFFACFFVPADVLERLFRRKEKLDSIAEVGGHSVSFVLHKAKLLNLSFVNMPCHLNLVVPGEKKSNKLKVEH